MIKLSVNVDHVATVRQARMDVEPDPVAAAVLCELAGAHGITVHLREDRRHMQDRDIELLRQTVKTRLNLEMGANEEIIKIALRIKPDQVTLVPEKRRELTTEGGLNVVRGRQKLAKAVERFKKAGIAVSIFVEPDESQLRAASSVGADIVELHTGIYANARTERTQQREFQRLSVAAVEAHELDLRVHAGHGLTYRNTPLIAMLPNLEEVSIGHNIIARAVLVGLERAVGDILALLERPSPAPRGPAHPHAEAGFLR